MLYAGVEPDDDGFALCLPVADPCAEAGGPLLERLGIVPRLQELLGSVQVLLGDRRLYPEEADFQVVGEGRLGFLEGGEAAVVIALLDDLPQPVFVEPGLELCELGGRLPLSTKTSLSIFSSRRRARLKS